MERRPGAAVVDEPVLEQEESGDLTDLAFLGLMGCVTDCEEVGEAASGDELSKLVGMVNSVNSLLAEGWFTDGEESSELKSDAGTVNVRSLWNVLLPTMSMGTEELAEVESVSVVESLPVELESAVLSDMLEFYWWVIVTKKRSRIKNFMVKHIDTCCVQSIIIIFEKGKNVKIKGLKSYCYLKKKKNIHVIA